MIDTGQLVRARRTDMGLTLSELSRQMGGSPIESFLSKAERGLAPLPRESALKLARILSLPEEAVLNVYGHVTEGQAETAIGRLAKAIEEVGDIPRAVEFPVLDATGRTMGKLRRMIHGRAEGFIIELEGPVNEPYAGEVMAFSDRAPQNGQGVVAEIKGELSAWTYNEAAGKKWIENGRGERRATGYKVRGVIAQVRSVKNLLAPQ